MAYVGTVALACGAYQGGSLEASHSRSLHCVDVGVSRDARTGADRLVLEYEVGNRCREAVDIDFSAIRVLKGHDAVLEANDPRHELRPGVLDGGRHMRQSIAYVVPPELQTVDEACVFFDGFADGADETPVCFSVSEPTP